MTIRYWTKFGACFYLMFGLILLILGIGFWLYRGGALDLWTCCFGIMFIYLSLANTDLRVEVNAQKDAFTVFSGSPLSGGKHSSQYSTKDIKKIKRKKWHYAYQLEFDNASIKLKFSRKTTKFINSIVKANPEITIEGSFDLV